MNNNFAECKEHYQQALKAANKEQRHHVHRGTYPYLQVLDEILPAYMTAGEVNLGLIDIPIDKIVGTKTKGRTHAFAANHGTQNDFENMHYLFGCMDEMIDIV